MDLGSLNHVIFNDDVIEKQYVSKIRVKVFLQRQIKRTQRDFCMSVPLSCADLIWRLQRLIRPISRVLCGVFWEGGAPRNCCRPAEGDFLESSFGILELVDHCLPKWMTPALCGGGTRHTVGLYYHIHKSCIASSTPSPISNWHHLLAVRKISEAVFCMFFSEHHAQDWLIFAIGMSPSRQISADL